MAKLTQTIKPLVFKAFEQGITAYRLSKQRDDVSRPQLYRWFREWREQRQGDAA